MENSSNSEKKDINNIYDEIKNQLEEEEKEKCEIKDVKCEIGKIICENCSKLVLKKNIARHYNTKYCLLAQKFIK
mgnify:CR=1 FL=1